MSSYNACDAYENIAYYLKTSTHEGLGPSLNITVTEAYSSKSYENLQMRLYDFI